MTIAVNGGLSQLVALHSEQLQPVVHSEAAALTTIPIGQLVIIYPKN